MYLFGILCSWDSRNWHYFNEPRCKFYWNALLWCCFFYITLHK